MARLQPQGPRCGQTGCANALLEFLPQQFFLLNPRCMYYLVSQWQCSIVLEPLNSPMLYLLSAVVCLAKVLEFQ